MDDFGWFDAPEGLEEAEALGVRGESESELTPWEPLTAAEIDQLAGPITRFGLTRRDELIFGAICFEGRTAEEVAREHYLAPRTVQNIARTTMRRLARVQREWDALAIEELEAEYDRLEGLWQLASEATRDYLQGRVRGRQRFIAVRYLNISDRIMTALGPLQNEIVLRCEAADRRHVRTVPPRVGRRKRMGGRGLRLPLFVVRAPAECTFAVARKRIRPIVRLSRGVLRTGIPPPATAAERREVTAV